MIGSKFLSIKLPLNYGDAHIKAAVSKELGISEFSFQIEKKSLDCRKRKQVCWQLKVLVTSEELKGSEPIEMCPQLDIPAIKGKKKAVITGSGPAGFFSALVLQKAGFETTILERGCDVDKRARGIEYFEKTGDFDPLSNYPFGEGGAGTFSDGKLTSRTKKIAFERQFIIDTYLEAGAPEEIRYLAHPHIGSDNLRKITKSLREKYQSLGGKIMFETELKDITVKDGNITEALTDSGSLDGDVFVIAPGHSSYDCYRMLMGHGVKFRIKNFALGSRLEHRQELINNAQWGCEKLPGIKAAEYRLSVSPDNTLPVYTFCMCPGGTVVPASAYDGQSVVNGMSLYERDGKYANAGCVAAVDLNRMMNREVSPAEALNWLESLEKKFYDHTCGFKLPSCAIEDFINKKEPTRTYNTSYPLGLEASPLWELLPQEISSSIAEGLKNFCRKLKGFEKGQIMGLESKTSSPVQALRDDDRSCPGFPNLYIAGEGSGYAGGIITSAADGIKAAISIIQSNL